MVEQISHRHHYTPEFYLKQWCGPGDQVLVYRRVASKIVKSRKAPKATGFERDLNSFIQENPWTPITKPDVVESDFFGPIDSKASLVLKQILAGEELSDDDKTAWARFLNSLLERDVRTLEQNDQLAREVVRAVARDPPRGSDPKRWAKALRHQNLDAMANNHVRREMVNSIDDPSALEACRSLNWVTVYSDTDTLITCDQPLVVNFGIEPAPIYALSLALSPRALFLAFPKSVPMVSEATAPLMIEKHLSAVLTSQARYLYSHRVIEDTWFPGLPEAAEKHFDKKPPATLAVSSMHQGR